MINIKLFHHSKTFLAVCVATTALMATSLQAADAENFDIRLKASIPSDDFHVRPVDSGWLSEEQEMLFDLGTSKLQAIEKLFQYKNSAGAIQATLNNTNSSGKSQLSNGNQTIPLKVLFNGTEVKNTAETVVSIADAQAGGRANLRITAGSDTALDPATYAGEYTGTVSLTFEPVVGTP